jgi:hypothetical protein
MTTKKPKRTFLRRLERSSRLMLSDFFHLFTPGERKVYSWREILIGSLILGFLVTMVATFL